MAQWRTRPRNPVQKYYILKDRVVVPVANVLVWSYWMHHNDADRIVAKTVIGAGHVSTVFLGMDHQLGEGPPLLFETVVIGGPYDKKMWHCSTWAEAEARHAAACDYVRGSP
jgi:hypothetical protein